jgi:hypothetical protein
MPLVDESGSQPCGYTIFLFSSVCMLFDCLTLTKPLKKLTVYRLLMFIFVILFIYLTYGTVLTSYPTEFTVCLCWDICFCRFAKMRKSVTWIKTQIPVSEKFWGRLWKHRMMFAVFERLEWTLSFSLREIVSRGRILGRNPDKSLKNFSPLLFTLTSTALPWDLYFFKLS